VSGSATSLKTQARRAAPQGSFRNAGQGECTVSVFRLWHNFCRAVSARGSSARRQGSRRFVPIHTSQHEGSRNGCRFRCACCCRLCGDHAVRRCGEPERRSTRGRVLRHDAPGLLAHARRGDDHRLARLEAVGLRPFPASAKCGPRRRGGVRWLWRRPEQIAGTPWPTDVRVAGGREVLAARPIGRSTHAHRSRAPLPVPPHRREGDEAATTPGPT
jgi:hypothetical protein